MPFEPRVRHSDLALGIIILAAQRERLFYSYGRKGQSYSSQKLIFFCSKVNLILESVILGAQPRKVILFLFLTEVRLILGNVILADRPGKIVLLLFYS